MILPVATPEIQLSLPLSLSLACANAAAARTRTTKTKDLNDIRVSRWRRRSLSRSFSHPLSLSDCCVFFFSWFPKARRRSSKTAALASKIKKKQQQFNLNNYKRVYLRKNLLEERQEEKWRAFNKEKIRNENDFFFKCWQSLCFVFFIFFVFVFALLPVSFSVFLFWFCFFSIFSLFYLLHWPATNNNKKKATTKGYIKKICKEKCQHKDFCSLSRTMLLSRSRSFSRSLSGLRSSFCQWQVSKNNNNQKIRKKKNNFLVILIGKRVTLHTQKCGKPPKKIVWNFFF